MSLNDLTVQSEMVVWRINRRWQCWINKLGYCTFWPVIITAPYTLSERSAISIDSVFACLFCWMGPAVHRETDFARPALQTNLFTHTVFSPCMLPWLSTPSTHTEAWEYGGLFALRRVQAPEANAHMHLQRAPLPTLRQLLNLHNFNPRPWILCSYTAAQHIHSPPGRHPGGCHQTMDWAQ